MAISQETKCKILKGKNVIAYGDVITDSFDPDLLQISVKIQVYDQEVFKNEFDNPGLDWIIELPSESCLRCYLMALQIEKDGTHSMLLSLSGQPVSSII
ncbi:MAG: hypothetical protein HRT61_10230 [Ekhidna sp.]|nr:hypothetical protein [Ekhidna sp.]